MFRGKETFSIGVMLKRLKKSFNRRLAKLLSIKITNKNIESLKINSLTIIQAIRIKFL